MAWGIYEPSDFDDLSPGGKFVGLDEQLLSLWNTYPPALKAEYSMGGFGTFISYYQFSEKYRKDRGPIPPAECPGHFDLRRKRKRLGDLISTNERLLAVSAPLKDVIENLEPGVHQFWPMRITIDEGKEEWPTPYFALRIGQFIESFLPIDGTCRESRMHSPPCIRRLTKAKRDMHCLRCPVRKSVRRIFGRNDAYGCRMFSYPMRCRPRSRARACAS